MANPAISPASAQAVDPEITTRAVVVSADLEEARNATSVARSATSLVTALRAEVSAADTAAVVVVALAGANRLAIHVAGTAIWLVTAHRDRSATTVFLTCILKSSPPLPTNF